MQLYTVQHRYYRYYINISKYGNLILMCKKQIAEIRKTMNILVSYTVIGYSTYNNGMVMALLVVHCESKNKTPNSCP